MAGSVGLSNDLETVFVGKTGDAHRRYASGLLRHLREKHEVQKVYVPTAGAFTLVKAAIHAGFEPDQIYASDMSLFTSLIGYYLAGRPVEDLPLKLRNQEEDATFRAFDSEAEKVAYCLWLAKMAQLRTDRHYEKLVWDEYERKGPRYIEQMQKKLEASHEVLAGINYEIMDVRDEVEAEHPDAVVIPAPPAYLRGYSRMFAPLETVFEFDVEIIEWEGVNEFDYYYDLSCGHPEPYLWFKLGDLGELPRDHVVFTLEASSPGMPSSRLGGMLKYWLFTKPALIEDWAVGRTLLRPTMQGTKPVDAKIATDENLHEGAEIKFVSVSGEVAQHYRGLWAKNFAAYGRAPGLSFLLMVDGAIAGVCGAHGDMYGTRANDSGDMLLYHGFVPPCEGHPRLGRLLMRAVTTREFLKAVHDARSVDRLMPFDGIRTIVFTKRRKMKLNTGIFDLIKRDRKKDGYKLTYRHDWRDESLADVLNIYLAEVAETEAGDREVEVTA